MIELNKVSKSYGPHAAVSELSLTVRPGDVVGFLGPNGAGKSTTMRMLTGFLTPSSGSITVCNMTMDEAELAIKQRIGYLPEGAPCYEEMTVLEFLSFIADVRDLTGEEKRQRLQQVVCDVELDQVLNQKIETLSKGFKRRVGLAQALVHDPEILLLDEPTDGLDPNQKHQVRKLIENLAQDKMVIVSTHILEEVTAVCNRAVIIDKGRKVFDGTPAELEAMSTHHHSITLELAQSPVNPDEMAELAGVAEVIVKGTQLVVVPFDGKLIFDSVYQKAKDLGWSVRAIYTEKGRLDDVFRELTCPAHTD